MTALCLAVLLAATDAGERPLYYEDKRVHKEDLQDRSLRELTLMRNWIYARAGNSFRRRWLDAFFRAQSWYRPGTLDEKLLSGIDRVNAEYIASDEAALTVPELTKMRDAARARNDELELRLISVRLGGWAGEGEPPADLSPLEEPKKLEKLITLQQLDDMSPRDLKLLRNTIFARHGRAFTTPDVKGHFSTIAWYKPDPKYSDDRLTPVDKKNIQLIKSLEDKLNPKEPPPNWYGRA